MIILKIKICIGFQVTKEDITTTATIFEFATVLNEDENTGNERRGGYKCSAERMPANCNVQTTHYWPKIRFLQNNPK